MLLILFIILIPVASLIVMFWIGFQSDKQNKKHRPTQKTRDDYDRQELEIRAHAGDEMARILLAERYGEWEDAE